MFKLCETDTINILFQSSLGNVGAVEHKYLEFILNYLFCMGFIIILNAFKCKSLISYTF